MYRPFIGARPILHSNLGSPPEIIPFKQDFGGEQEKQPRFHYEVGEKTILWCLVFLIILPWICCKKSKEKPNNFAFIWL